MTRGFTSTAALAFLLTLLLTACGSDTPSTSAPGTSASFKNAPVILISIDTLRSDRLPAYGYQGVETPAIDALRRDAILYERAWAHYPLTFPSHVSMLSGLLPTEHGVRDNVGYAIPDGLTWLPRELRDAGYATGAAVSAYILRGDTGFGEGFDFYEDALDLKSGAALGESQRPGTLTTQRAITWLEEVVGGNGGNGSEGGDGGNGRPFFLFLHLYEPHTPYTAPEPFASRYADPYDAEVAASDASVGRLFDALRRLGVYDASLIILTSDHGEGLGDHGEQEHGILLHREAIQVPLLVKLPGAAHAGATVRANAQLVDLAPTIREVAGLASPAGEGELAGAPVSLVHLAETSADTADPELQTRAIYTETWYPRLHLGWSELTSLVEEDLHYIEGPNPELYDLETDLTETRNVLRDRRRDYARLRDRLATLERELEAPGEVDPETARQLAALGYLSTSAAVDDGPLPDPKEKLPSLDDLMRAFSLFRNEDFPAAAQAFQRVIDENPAMSDAWEHLGLSLRQMGRYDDAEAAYQRAMELTGGGDHIALGLARLYAEMGRKEDARSHAELAFDTNPAMAHQVLAEMAAAEDAWDDVEHHAKAALEAKPGSIPARLHLAQTAVARENLETAERWANEAEAEQAKRHDDETTSGLYFVRGEILARQGRSAEAEAAYREEIRRHPLDTRPYTRLAVLYALLDRSAEATGVLREMTQANDTPVSYAAAVEALRVLGDGAQAARLLHYALGRFPGDPKLVEMASEG